jgi:hypothetical protein
VRHDGGMPEPPAPTAPIVYQLRVVLRHISPLIWRRLLVRSDSTIADLHTALQIALGWSDQHLHCFVIQGRMYGTEGCGNPRRIRLIDLGLRVRERFLYEYDFIDGWQHDVRVERSLPVELGRRYPLCIGGRRAIPPEDCGGPWAFLELRQRYSVVVIAERLLELLSPLVSDTNRLDDDDEDGDDHDDRNDAVDEHYEELVDLLRWLKIDRFDRRAVNRQLAQLGLSASRAAA